jgi:hypothetical protein
MRLQSEDRNPPVERSTRQDRRRKKVGDKKDRTYIVISKRLGHGR